jgi:hypothetical protein
MYRPARVAAVRPSLDLQKLNSIFCTPRLPGCGYQLMSNCKYCGRSAGFLRHVHAECENKHEQGKRSIFACISTAIVDPLTGLTSAALTNKIGEIAEQSFIPETERRELSIRAWCDTVDTSLHDNILDDAVEKRLMELKDRLELSQEELNGTGGVVSGAYSRVIKSAVVRDVLNGVIPQRMNITGHIPINFQKGEKIVWLFNDVSFLEDRSRREYVGRSQGVSIRVMKGVYYRTGSFAGQPITYNERVHIDTGSVAVTDKNFYFVGSSKSMRIPYKKIVSFQPFTDGVGITRDLASAKLQIFVTGDGWFTYNLVANLAQL